MSLILRNYKETSDAHPTSSMDHEVELNYRLTGHLQNGESVLATLISNKEGIYAATDRRILCLKNDMIGYRLRVHPYRHLESINCFADNGAWYVQFTAGDRELTIRARSAKEAKKFVVRASKLLPQDLTQSSGD